MWCVCGVKGEVYEVCVCVWCGVCVVFPAVTARRLQCDES